ncbi:MAG: 5-formyltetrahydrofolate cyclo-ligase [Saprospiraceae bacterium]
MDEKRLLRKKMIDLRDAMVPETRRHMDRLLCQSLRELILERRPKIVHTYLPMPMEIDFLPVIHQMLEEHIRVVVPKTLRGGQLEHLILETPDQLEDGIFGTRHPMAGVPYEGPYDLIIVPGLAFDFHGNRLGYGGGYYDRFLPAHPEAYKTALCYSFQLMNNLPVEPHDIPLDSVLFVSSFESSNI